MSEAAEGRRNGKYLIFRNKPAGDYVQLVKTDEHDVGECVVYIQAPGLDLDTEACNLKSFYQSRGEVVSVHVCEGVHEKECLGVFENEDDLRRFRKRLERDREDREPDSRSPKKKCTDADADADEGKTDKESSAAADQEAGWDLDAAFRMFRHEGYEKGSCTCGWGEGEDECTLTDGQCTEKSLYAWDSYCEDYDTYYDYGEAKSNRAKPVCPDCVQCCGQ